MDSMSPQDRQSAAADPVRKNSNIAKWLLAGGALLVAAFLLLLNLLSSVTIGGLGIVSLLVGIVLAVLPVPVYLALALFIDRYEREPLWMLAGAFVWGAAGATLIAIIINTIVDLLFASLFGAEIGKQAAASFSAPVVEESAKGLALFIFFLWKKDEFDGVIDGIVYAAMVALGFAMVENFDYYGRAFMHGGVSESVVVFVLRGVISPFNHPLFTSMTGIGLGLARQSTRSWVKVVAPIIGFAAAVTLHFLWNSLGVPLAAIGVQNVLVVLLIQFLLVVVPAGLGVLAVVFFALRREGRIVRHYLTPELQSGLLTQQEYGSLGSVSGRLGASFNALISGGFGAWRRRARFSQEATELAFHRDRVSRGITSGEDAQREAAYVQLLRDLKGATSHAPPGQGAPPRQEAATAKFEAPPAAFRALLRSVDGPTKGEAFEVGQAGATMGRSPDNPIELADNSISRRHARIEFRDGGYWLIDLDSSNGTFVNQDRLSAPRRLQSGDVIGLGATRLSVTLEAETAG